MQSTYQNKHQGFTIVEVLVIAPIIILALGAFIAVMVNMTAEVLKTQSENSMVQSTQDALNTIEQDIKISGQFLAANELTAQTPQGYLDGNGAANSSSNVNSFTNVTTGDARSKMLILRTFTTDKNPIDGTRQPIYTDQPTASCDQKTVNKLFSSNTIYFVKNNVLWKRTIIQQGSGRPNLCGAPWQQPSCSSTVSKGTYCKVNDTRLANNVSDFTIDYFVNPGDTTPIANAVDATKTITERNDALSNVSTVRVTISTLATVAGREVSNSASLRATKLNITSDPPVVVSLGFNQQPNDEPAVPGDGAVKFTTGANISSATYQWQLSTNGGSTWANITNGANYSGATTNELTVSNYSTTWNGYQYRAVITNFGDTSTSNPATLTVSNWGNITYLNGFGDYQNGTSPYSKIGYTKTSQGVVMLKGLVEKSSAVTSGDVIGVLPPNSRPTDILIFQTSTNANVASRVDIYPNGEIRVNVGDAGWISLEGITFIPSDTSLARSTLTPTNGWVNYGGSFPDASYVRDGLGRVHTQGLIRYGNIADGTQLITGMQSNAFTPEYLHLPARSTTSSGIGIDPSSGIVAKGVGTNGYISLQSMYYSSGSATWTNLALQNSWIAYGGFSSPQYTKGSDNIVRLKGLIKGGSTAYGTVVANLPAGYRPKERTLLAALCNPQVYCRIDVLPNGNVELYLANSGWTALDNVVFLAEL
jgi:hypothetical protein